MSWGRPLTTLPGDRSPVPIVEKEFKSNDLKPFHISLQYVLQAGIGSRDLSLAEVRGCHPATHNNSSKFVGKEHDKSVLFLHVIHNKIKCITY